MSEGKLNLWQVLHSVLASFFGVQSNAKRRRDFSRGRAHQFIIVGLVLTVLFIFAVLGAVQIALLLV